MATTEVFALPDKNIIPDDNLIFSIISDKKPVWQAIKPRSYTELAWRFFTT